MITTNNEQNALTVTLPHFSLSESRVFVTTLLDNLKGLDEQLLNKDDIYYTCTLIEAMLPSEDLYYLLEQSLKGSEVDTKDQEILAAKNQLIEVQRSRIEWLEQEVNRLSQTTVYDEKN